MIISSWRACVNGQIAQNLEVIDHQVLFLVFQAGDQVVFLDVQLKPVILQDFSHKEHPLEPTVVIGGAPLKVKTDVVFSRSLAHQSFDG